MEFGLGGEGEGKWVQYKSALGVLPAAGIPLVTVKKSQESEPGRSSLPSKVLKLLGGRGTAKVRYRRDRFQCPMALWQVESKAQLRLYAAVSK